MLAVFRAFAKSWAAKLLFGLLLIAFVVWGIQGGLVPHISTEVIRAGNRTVSEIEFRDQIQQILDQQRAQGAEIPPMDQLLKMQFPQNVAQRMAAEQAYAAWIEGAGVKPDKSLIRDLLTNFVNPITGAFDEDRFNQFLATKHLDRNVVLRALTDEVASRHLETAAQAGLRSPNLYAALLANYMMETRDASFFVLDPRGLGPAPTPSEADLKSLYDQSQSGLRVPETRELSVVIFDPRKLAPAQTVDPALVRKEFDFKKDTYAVPEKRTFAMIAVKDAKAAAQAAAALRAGQSADAAAKAAGGQAQTQTDVPRTALPDPNLAAAVFGLKPGQTSDPIQGAGGFAVVKLQSVTAGRAATFEEKRAEIEDALRLRAAQDKIQDMVQKYGELRDSGASAADAGRQVGADVSDTPPVTAQGATADGKPFNASADPTLLRKIVSEGFAQSKGGGSGQPKKLGEGYYFDVGVKAVHPSYLPKFEEVHDRLAQMWTMRNAESRAKATAADLLKRLQKGESIDQLAASVHAQVEHKTDLRRPRGGQPDMASLAMGIVFAQSKGKPFAEPLQPNLPFRLIGRVDAIHAPATAIGAEAAANGRPNLDQGFSGVLVETLRTAAASKIKPKVDEANLKAALGTNDQAAPSQ